MFSIFPEILFLGPVGVALLRVVAGIAMLYMAYAMYDKRKEMERTKVPLIGHAPEALILFGAAAAGIVGICLVIGLGTQVAALIAFVAAMKNAFFAVKYKDIVPYPRSSALLLAAIALSLVVSGAGAFAFDLPL